MTRLILAIVALVASATILTDIWLLIATNRVDDQRMSLDALIDLETQLNRLNALAVVAYLLPIIPWLVWQFRTGVNMKRLNPHAEYGPHAIWFWMVPFANLFAPYAVVRSYWRQGGPRQILEHRGPSPTAFRLWWFGWLVQVVAAVVASVANGNVDSIDDVFTVYAADALRWSLVVLAALNARKVIKLVNDRFVPAVAA